LDAAGNLVTPTELQNRGVWYEYGNSKEQAFVSAFGTALGVRHNPDKGNDPTAPDLALAPDLATLADLKCQNTPLFYAGWRYQVPADFAVTFNLKDALRYGPHDKNYQNFTIFYWVNWVAVQMVTPDGRRIGVRPLHGLWRVTLATLETLRGQAPIHWYAQRRRRPEMVPEQQELLFRLEPRLRQEPGLREGPGLRSGQNTWAVRDQDGNATCSYVFDLRQFEPIAVSPSPRVVSDIMADAKPKA
jgi:hypothetical protein